MNIPAKKVIFAALIAVLAVAAWQSVVGDNLHVNIDGDQIDGPMGALLGLMLTGGGMLVALLACLCAALLVGLVFAGLGLLMVSGLALAVTIGAALISPLLLPILIPLGLYWFFSARARRQRVRATLEQAV